MKMKMKRIAIAVAAIAVGVATLPTIAGSAPEKTRQLCSKKYLRELNLHGDILSATSPRPNCGGAALMASDMQYDAQKRFPRQLKTGYKTYAHGTNTAGDPAAVYLCRITNKFVKTRDGGYMKTTAVCSNPKGESFKYAFRMA